MTSTSACPKIERTQSAIFLIGQGIVRSSIGSHGYGASQPVATNDTATGRQQNRRVELVVSGEVIGAPIGAAVEAKPQR
jgi:hypothetical protein